MHRRVVMIAFVIAVFCFCQSNQPARGELIPETTAARHGLTRPWFAQVELDQSRGRVTNVILRGGVLYIQTDRAMVHAIDAETGRTLWSERIGRPNHPSMTPDALGGLLAVVNGSRLYLVDRYNGKMLREIEIKEGPGAGPALSSKRVYVPMVSGMVVAYPLTMIDDPKRKEKKKAEEGEGTELEKKYKPAPEFKKQADEPPLHCRSYGRALIQPLVTRDDAGAEYTVWPTDKGYVYFGRIDRQNINSFITKFRLETHATIVGQPAYLPPDPKVIGDSGLVFSVSSDGFVYAVKEEDGDTLWRFSTGEPIVNSPAVIGDHLYVATQLGGMYCLGSKTGENLWFSPGIVQFIAASGDRVYAADRLGRILILDAANGARLDTMNTEKGTVKLANTDTDRIYLIDRKGLVQCLREQEQAKPIMHDRARKEAVKPIIKEDHQAEPEASPEPEADPDNPFA